MSDVPAGLAEDIKINDKPYRLVPGTYQINDVSDYAPRGETPGTSASFGDLQLYQPLAQETWTTGLGYVWGTDPAGYLLTDGDVDARFPGSIMLASKVAAHQTLANFVVGNMVPYDSSNPLNPSATGVKTFFCDKSGGGGLRYFSYTGGVIDAGSTQVISGADINYCWTNGTYFFINFSDGDLDDADERNGLMFYSTTPGTADGTRASLTTAVTGSNNDLTLTALEAGTGGNSITLEYTAPTGITAGNEVVVVTGTDIVVQIESGVSTASQVLAALRADSDAMYLVHCALAAGNDGSGAVVTGGPWSLASGAGTKVWNKCGVNGFARGFGQTVLHNGYAYVLEEGTNYVHYASETDMSDIEGDGPLDTAVITVGPGDIPVVQLITYGTSLFAARYDGLWAIGEDNIARKVLDFTDEYSASNFASIATWNGLLIFPIRNKIYSWNGARLVDITPMSNADPNPSPRVATRVHQGIGRPMALAPIDGSTFDAFANFDSFIGIGEYFFCTAARARDTTSAYLLAWSGSGWHSVNELPAANNKYAGSWFDPVTYYQFFFEGATGGAFNGISHKRLDQYTEYPLAGQFPTTGTHKITFSAMTMGQKRVLKSSPSVVISVQNCTAARTVAVEYSLDGGSWVTLDTIDSNGVHELNFAGNPPTKEPPSVEYYWISLRLTLVTDSASQTPVVEDVTIRYIMRPGTVYGWVFDIVGATDVRYRDALMDQTSEEIKQQLQTARNSAPPIRYIDVDGSEYWVYLTSFNGRLVAEADKGGRESGALEYRFRVSLVETGLITV